MLGLGLVHFEPTQLRHGNQSPAEEWAKQKEHAQGEKNTNTHVSHSPQIQMM